MIGIPIKERARNRWKAILPALGVDSKYLTGKHTGCPLCRDGKDCFRFDDRDGGGSWLCSKCGRAGEGVKLVMLYLGLDFAEAAREVEKHLGAAPPEKPKPQRTAEAKREAMRWVWDGAVPVTLDDPAGRYLANRTGLRVFPKCLRYSARTAYKLDDGTNAYFPALLARVDGLDGVPANMMRIFLREDGIKADVPEPKKTMEGSLPAGCAVRLMSPLSDGALGISTGIETALAAAMIFKVPVWATLNDNRLEAWSPPDDVRKVMVFGDNDAGKSFSGQAAAYALAKRLIGPKFKREVEVYIPEIAGADWADVLVQISRVA